MNANRRRNLVSWGIIVGALSGAIGAYFFAPQNGDKTKKDLAKKINHFSQHSILKAQNALIQFESKLEESSRK